MRERYLLIRGPLEACITNARWLVHFAVFPIKVTCGELDISASANLRGAAGSNFLVKISNHIMDDK